MEKNSKQKNKLIKLQIPAGKATPAPPVGTALGPAGVNSQEFCTKFNEATKDKTGMILPVEITVKPDKSYTFVVKTPPAAFLIKKKANVEKAGATGKTIVGSISHDDLLEIAKIKMPDLNAYDLDAAYKQVAGTAKNMGIEITE